MNGIAHEIDSGVEEQASVAHAVVKAMERMRELVQQTTSGSTGLAASAEQMSKMSRDLLDSMNSFGIGHESDFRAQRARKPAPATPGSGSSMPPPTSVAQSKL